MGGCKCAYLCEQYTDLCIAMAEELGTWNLQSIYREVAQIRGIKKSSVEKLVSYYTKKNFGKTAKEYIMGEVEK